MLVKHSLYVVGKELLKDCRKGLKMSSASTAQGQQTPGGLQAAIVCLPFWQCIEKMPSVLQLVVIECLTYQCGQWELKIIRTQNPVLGTRASFALCLSTQFHKLQESFLLVFRNLNKAVLTGTSFVGTLLQAALIGKAWLSSGEQQAEEGLTPEQRVPSEEHARSHDVPWKEQGLYFSFRFQAHVVTACSRHARNFIP